MTGFLFLLQPLARLLGRLRHGLTFWRRQAGTGYAFPRLWTADIWTQDSRPIEERLESLERALHKRGAVPIRGNDFDRWDLEVRGGLLGSARLRMAVEHHGSGRELLRIQWWPQWSFATLVLGLTFSGLCAASALDGAWRICALLGGLAVLIAIRTIQECAATTGAFLAAVREIKRIGKEDLQTTGYGRCEA